MRIGIDLGGTKTEAIVLDDAGRELARERVRKLTSERVRKRCGVFVSS